MRETTASESTPVESPATSRPDSCVVDRGPDTFPACNSRPGARFDFDRPAALTRRWQSHTLGITMTGMHRCRIAGIVILAVLAIAAGAPPPSPPPEAVPELAAQLAEHLRDRTVVAPDGTSVPVMAEGASAGPTGLLDTTRIEACLRTIAAGDAWPSAWLVVQVRDVPFDLVLPAFLGDDGGIEEPEIVFAAERREWTVDGLREAIRAETGRKPRGRAWNVIVQGFRTRIERRYVYEVPGERRGLLELLPEGTLLREATTVRLAGGERYTLALVLQQAELVPSSCEDCASWMIGHADTGRILLVLVSDTEVAAELDVTPWLAGAPDRPLLPRYACNEGDRRPSFAESPIGERFAGRGELELLRLRDLDGDGLELEFSLLSGVSSCEPEYVRLGVGPGTPELRIVP
jgi:hypothetical protein